jgi:FAD:protein FMN transferase
MAAELDSMRRARALLGTFVEIAVPRENGRGMDVAIEAAFDAVAKVHRLMSFHDRASDVSRLNREAAAHAVAVDAWTFAVVEAAVDLHRRSHGVFDIAIASVLQRLGLLPDMDAPPSAGERTPFDAIETLPGHRIRFRHPGVRIDLGGIAKGFAVDRAVEVLRRHGATSGLVNAGGDLAAFGPAAQTVHLRDPREPGRSLGTVAIVDEALASTGGRIDPHQSPNAMASAVIDAATREPARAIQGVTVRAPSCIIADALTKIVMITGEAASPLLDHFGASALLVLPDGDVRVTASWQDSASRAA